VNNIHFTFTYGLYPIATTYPLFRLTTLMDKEPPSYEKVSKQGSSATISQTLSSSSSHQHYTPITNPYFTHTGNGNYSYTSAQNTLYPPQPAMGFHLNSSSIDPQLLRLQESWRSSLLTMTMSSTYFLQIRMHSVPTTRMDVPSANNPAVCFFVCGLKIW
jgi:hypothetical protein